MLIGEDAGPIHPTPTGRRELRYLFSKKHHGRGPADASRWLETLTHDEEFAIFDGADLHDLSNDGGDLYGLRVGPDGAILELGTWQQQVAEFPNARPGEPWHGYPLWPLRQAGPENRRGERHRPDKAIFLKMEAAGLLSARDRKRLMRGDHA